mgnify:FL=1|tara:strand:+ start:472 stop:924 length:453 start_codon:yes stop_codon:yes gene_type:complete
MEKQLEQFNNQYSVTDTGIVYSLKGKKKKLIGKITKSGYREVVLNHKGKKKYLLVHRLVATLFIENTNNSKTVNHKDGNKLNNSASNLEWLTCQENLKHARDNGLLKTKITKEIAEKIYNDTGSIRFLAKKYNIGKTQVGYIKQGKRWME